MSNTFEIEAVFKTGKGSSVQCFVFAKCMTGISNLSVTENSKLDDIEIQNYLHQPRTLDEKGNPRFDVFAFKIRHKEDWNTFYKGQIVKLTNQ